MEGTLNVTAWMREGSYLSVQAVCSLTYRMPSDVQKLSIRPLDMGLHPGGNLGEEHISNSNNDHYPS